VSFVSPDNDGAGWFQNPVGCGIASGADHQTVGGGAFAPGLVGVGYPDTVYYCAQAIATAQCALSVNGGISLSVETEHDPSDSLLIMIVRQPLTAAATGEQEGAGENRGGAHYNRA
jgi:hypothetical protein